MRNTSFEEFDRLFERMLHSTWGGTHRLCGCEMVMGPDGVPHVRQFGNLPSTTNSGRHLPIDVIDDEKNGLLKLVAEIPGVEKDDIEVSIDGDVVYIRANRGETKYEGSVPVASAVDSNSAKASYRNGILEVSFVVESGPKGQRVRVE